MMKIVLLFFIVTFLVTPVSAQEDAKAWFAADNGAPLVGEPFQLVLSARLPRDVTILSWPQLPPQWPPFELTQAGELLIRENPDGTMEYRQIFEVLLWLPGEHQTPPLALLIQQAGRAETSALPVEPVFVAVPSVLEGAQLTLLPFKPQAALPYTSPLIYAGLAAAAAGGVIVVARWLWSRRAVLHRPSRRAENIGPAAAALETMQRLDVVTLPPEQIYAEAADALRVYVQVSSGQPALDMTTGELVEALGGWLSRPHCQELQLLLEQADLVKFARFQPRPDSASRYIGRARQWVHGVAGEQAGP